MLEGYKQHGIIKEFIFVYLRVVGLRSQLNERVETNK